MNQGTAPGFGLALGAVSACCYALSAICATFGYEAGLGPLTLIAARFGIGALFLIPLARSLGQAVSWPRRLWPLLAFGALGSLGMGCGYFLAFKFLPVQLAVLIFYLFPLIIVLADCVAERRRPTPALLLAIGLALCGLALALGVDSAGIDWRGVAFGLFAAFSSIPTFFSFRALAREGRPLAITGQLSLLSFLAIAIPVSLDGITWPSSGEAFLGLGLVSLFFIAAGLLQLYAAGRAPAGPLAAMYNFEPLFTILVAWALLGQVLAPTQWLGVLLLLGGLFLVVYVSSRQRAVAP